MVVVVVVVVTAGGVCVCVAREGGFAAGRWEIYSSVKNQGKKCYFLQNRGAFFQFYPRQMCKCVKLF